MRHLLRFAAMAVVLVALSFGLLPTDRATADNPSDVPVTPGELVIRGEEGKPAGACPLKHTDVDAQISGFIARVNVTQTFHNPSQDKIEAIYTFPLPDDSAVDYMEMKVGARTIVGEIRRREEAKQIYETAKEAGHVAGLLDQERPNIFTQSVANIMPGEIVKITISYTQLLKYEASAHEFVFPMVVGPRFNPGTPVGHQGTGVKDDTDQVPDASKITPPVTPKDTRAGHDISIKVEINAGIPVYAVKCKTHEITTEFPGKTSALVTLKRRSTIPNKDFVLDIEVAGDEIGSGMITSAPGGKGGFFTLIMQPPKAVKPQAVTPKEMIFVIDTSGSQMGEPLAKSKETMLHCIKNVNPGDTFNMVSFSDKVRKLFEQPQPYTEENLEAALKFLKECEAGGGTYMMPAIKEALEPAPDPKRLRVVVFFTDGYIGNDFEIIDFVRKHSQNGRVFPFGIGSSVNRFLIEKMAEYGRGASDIVLLNANSQEVASTFYDRIRNPLLTDITVDWGGLPIVAEEVYPRDVPDLFSAQPLILKGYYTAAASGKVTVRGRANGQPWSQTMEVTLPESQSDNDALASIWARSKVDDLMSKDLLGAQTGNADPNIKDEICELAINYRLMTQYTSFVAVENMVVTTGGQPRTVAVPVEMPEGLCFDDETGWDKNHPGRLAVAARGVAAYGLGGYAPTSVAATRATSSAYFRSPNGTAKVAPLTAAGAPVQPALTDGRVVEATTEEVKRPTGVAVNGKASQKKLDQALVELLSRHRKAGASGSYTAPAKLVVKNGKVEVMVWVKGCTKEQLARLVKLGLAQHSWALKDKALIGWAPVGKLEEIARLEFVTRIAPPDYVSKK